MASVTSASTDAQVWAAYDDNASFEEDDSPTKAAAFVTACRVLLRRRPTQISADGLSTAFDAQAIRDELARATRFLAANRDGAGGKVKHLSFSGLRD